MDILLSRNLTLWFIHDKHQNKQGLFSNNVHNKTGNLKHLLEYESKFYSI